MMLVQIVLLVNMRCPITCEGKKEGLTFKLWVIWGTITLVWRRYWSCNRQFSEDIMNVC